VALLNKDEQMRSSKDGFTLIELLIVVVIIGILAAIAIPKFSSTREKAYTASIRSDLRHVANLQESYFAEHHQYTTSTSALGFSDSEGVALSAITVTGTGWSASATHGGTSDVCAMFYGEASAVSPAIQAGVVTCG